jgi:hypothetical protein
MAWGLRKYGALTKQIQEINKMARARPERLNYGREDAEEQLHERGIADALAVRDIEGKTR